MISPANNFSFEQCQQARLSRDPRFDGKIFIGVKSTGIFCRPICPAKLPKEENVEYFADKTLALNAGYRPCLRCRPDSLINSWAWKGVETTFVRAVKMIDDGALQQRTLEQVSELLGVSDRYLRKLFTRYLGMSPKQYDLYSKLLFAKQLLQSSQLSITDIAFASGFNSTRRFNDAFHKAMQLTPTAVRGNKVTQPCQTLFLPYQGELNWQHMLDFYRLRAIQGIETISEQSYSRSVVVNEKLAWFSATPDFKGKKIKLELEVDDATQIKPLINSVRRMLDLDANTTVIETHLNTIAPGIVKQTGLRIPGVWSAWEAGVRAIIGQQVSVKAAISQLNRLVAAMNEGNASICFPTPQAMRNSDYAFLKMPQSRKDTLQRFAAFYDENPDSDPSEWLAIKGIGPWTVNYAQLRGQSLPDRLLDTDLIVKKARQDFPSLTVDNVSPWGSYATFHLWNQ